MVAPRCPFCNAQGLDKLAAKNLGYFSLIYCGQCGAIYGVVPTSPPKTTTESKPKTRPAAPSPGEPAPSPIPPVAKDQPKIEKSSSAEEALSFYAPTGSQHGFYTRIVADDEEEED